MARKQKKPEEEVSQEWLATYGDMVTLLLCFFVMMHSSAKIDIEKWEVMVKSFTGQNKADTIEQIVVPPASEGEGLPGNAGEGEGIGQEPAEGDFAAMMQELKDFAESQGLSDSVEIQGNNDYIFVRFKDSLLFPADSALLTQEGKMVIDFLGKGIKKLENQVQTIRVDGHTADTGSSNLSTAHWKLSSERAISVLTRFEERAKIGSSKLVATGYGKERPLTSNDTQENMAKNRRVEILIVRQQTQGNSQQVDDLMQQYFGNHSLDFNSNDI